MAKICSKCGADKNNPLVKKCSKCASQNKRLGNKLTGGRNKTKTNFIRKQRGN